MPPINPEDVSAIVFAVGLLIGVVIGVISSCGSNDDFSGKA